MIIVIWLFVGIIITDGHVGNDKSFAGYRSLKPLYDSLQLLLLMMMISVMGSK